MRAPSPAVAAQGHVEVVPQPGGERDVPALPELLGRTGEVGLAEVQRELEADQQRRRPEPCRCSPRSRSRSGTRRRRGPPSGSARSRRPARRRRRRRRAPAGSPRSIAFFRDSREEQPEPAPDARGVGAGAPRELGQQLVPAHDGPGDELGKEGDEERVVREALDSRPVAPVGVHGQGDDLKAVERDAEGEQDLGNGEVEPQGVQQRQQALDDEGRVLEEDQEPQGERDRGGQQEPAPARVGARVDGTEEGVAHPDVGEEQRQVGGDPEPVEDEAGGEQHGVRRPDALRPHRVQHQQQDQQEEGELDRDEEHQRTAGAGPRRTSRTTGASASASRAGPSGVASSAGGAGRAADGGGGA